MKKRIYEKPAMTVAVIHSQQQLMTGSPYGVTGTAGFDSYGPMFQDLN